MNMVARCAVLSLLISICLGACSSAPVVDIEARKKIAQALRENSLFAQSRAEYEALVASPGLTAEQRGALAYLIADICFTDTKQFADAAAWYIRAREYDPKGSYADQLGMNLVTALEKSGRLLDAQQQLAAATSPDTTRHAPDDKVVATFGQRTVYRSDVERTIQELPTELQQQLTNPDRRVAYLRQYVGVELLYDAARREQVDQGDEFSRRREAAVKRLMVDAYVSAKLPRPQRLDSTDVQNYYSANKAQFGGKPFAEVRQDVMTAYSNQKMESAYNDLVANLAHAQDLKINAENMK